MKKITALLICFWLNPAVDVRADELEAYAAAGPAPQLVLADLGNRQHRLVDYRGRVVLINFWASWCAPCIIEMPGMQRLQQKLAGRPFTILAVNVGETAGAIWKFLNKVKVDFTLLRDGDGQTARDWQVNVYPTTFLLDAAGKIRYVAYGARAWDSPEIVQRVEGLMGAVTTPQLTESDGRAAANGSRPRGRSPLTVSTAGIYSASGTGSVH